MFLPKSINIRTDKVSIQTGLFDKFTHLVDGGRGNIHACDTDTAVSIPDKNFATLHSTNTQ